MFYLSNIFTITNATRYPQTFIPEGCRFLSDGAVTVAFPGRIGLSVKTLLSVKRNLKIGPSIDFLTLSTVHFRSAARYLQ